MITPRVGLVRIGPTRRAWATILRRGWGKRIFKVDTVLAAPHRVAWIFAGAVDETRRVALETQAARHPPWREASQDLLDLCRAVEASREPRVLEKCENAPHRVARHPCFSYVTEDLGWSSAIT